MKMFNFTCPECGKFFYGDVTLLEFKVPIHCPGCDKYFYYEEYIKAFESKKDNSIARLNKTITDDNMFEIIYLPKK